MENEECDERQPEAQELFLGIIRILLPLGYAYEDINPYRLGFLYAKSSWLNIEHTTAMNIAFNNALRQ